LLYRSLIWRAIEQVIPLKTGRKRLLKKFLLIALKDKREFNDGVLYYHHHNGGAEVPPSGI
jgi:hypothetical protein